MGLDRRQLILDRAIEQTAAIPARDQRQPVAFEDRPQHRRIAGEFMAELDPGEPRLTRFGETQVERRGAAQFRQIVVAPADRADAEAHGHQSQLAPLLSSVSLAGGTQDCDRRAPLAIVTPATERPRQHLWHSTAAASWCSTSAAC